MTDVAIVGLGYVGLPLALAFAERGLTTYGLEVDANKIELLRRGKSYVEDITDEQVERALTSFTPTLDSSVLKHVGTIIICVPTPLRKTRDPDITFVIAAAEEVAQYIHPGLLVILESTTYPGTTEEVLKPILERDGLAAGEDFFLAFSPERIDPGNARFSIRNTPKVVGGLTPACTERAVRLYEHIIDQVIPVSSAKTAELVKLLENTFRVINIGLVNEMTMLCRRLGVDVWEVVEAAATKPFGYMPFYPGPGIGGHCLSADEFVFVRNGSSIDVLPIGDLISRLEADQGVRRVIDRDGTLILAPERLGIMSFDWRCGETGFKPAELLSRRAYSGDMVTVWTADGRRLTVTDGHPVMIWEAGCFRACRADELHPGQEMIIPLGQPSLAVPCIDLINHLSVSDLGRMRAKPETAQYADFAGQLGPRLRALGVAPGDVYKQNVMPLSAYLSLERDGAMPISRQAIRLATGRGPSYNSFPAILQVDEDVARLIGYYLSEGCLSEDPALGVGFTFCPDERETINDLINILRRLGVRYSTYRDRKWRAFRIHVSSRPLAILLRDALQCGTDARSMRVPGRLMVAPEPIRRALLTGLLRGDGDVHQVEKEPVDVKPDKTHGHHLNTCQAGYDSISPALFQQVVFLLQGLDLVPTFKPDKPQPRVHGEAHPERLSRLFPDAKRERLEAYRRGRRKPIPVKPSALHHGFATVKVREVMPAAPAEAVYSIEVEETHTFVTSFGLLVHNCIPVDPLYLSWKAKLLNFTTRFIELADDVNRRMPEYVVSRIADALNDQEKPIRGAKILLLGVAYKKDVADIRESPALEVLTLLLQRGAHIFYNDPFVSEFVKDDRRWRSSELNERLLDQADCSVILTDHSQYQWSWIVEHSKLVVDTRNATKRASAGEQIYRL